jgi:hypothetical protein
MLLFRFTKVDDRAIRFSEKGWVSGKGRSAIWRDIPWSEKTIEPQYLMAQNVFRESNASSGEKIGFMDVTSATNARTMIAAYQNHFPFGNSAPIQHQA